jgi:murein DD-endopeptidase MepM/ murein hydrolase activator NlpD
VDYAAPSGTPVVALGDGVVTHRGWAGGGGNTIKIKHPGNYVTSYMHLKGYAKGIVKGSRVTRGQLIGYVGSTGLSTGPHLDFRVYKNGKPIDPLKMESPSVEPVSKEDMPAFQAQMERYRFQMDSLGAMGHLYRYLDILK